MVGIWSRMGWWDDKPLSLTVWAEALWGQGLAGADSLPSPPSLQAFLSWFRNGLLASGIGVISFMQSDMGREAAYGECRSPLLLPPGSVDAPPTLVSVDSLLPHRPNSKYRTPHSSPTKSHLTLTVSTSHAPHCPSEWVVQGMVVGLPLQSDFSTKTRVLVPAPAPPTLSLLPPFL